MLNPERKNIISLCYSSSYINILMHILRVLSGFRIRLSAAAVIVSTRRCPKTLMSQLFIVSFLLAVLSGSAVAATCSAESGTRRVAFLALYENNLANEVTAGEQWGKRLRHGFVMRELIVPRKISGRGAVPINYRIKLDPRWKAADLHVAAFVQDKRSEEVLPVLALVNCR